ncbi:MAG TPA: T9SS type A sorting domain-containing protein, partial [Bacteroidales bacterium]|nr:T9SS type A sorting domain-containing protein [Bacteroidales bacterium]
LRIYSLSGQLLRVQSLAEPTSTALPAGFYVVRLQNSRQTQSHKVIVK